MAAPGEATSRGGSAFGVFGTSELALADYKAYEGPIWSKAAAGECRRRRTLRASHLSNQAATHSDSVDESTLGKKLSRALETCFGFPEPCDSQTQTVFRRIVRLMVLSMIAPIEQPYSIAARNENEYWMKHCNGFERHDDSHFEGMEAARDERSIRCWWERRTRFACRTFTRPPR